MLSNVKITSTEQVDALLRSALQAIALTPRSMFDFLSFSRTTLFERYDCANKVMTTDDVNNLINLLKRDCVRVGSTELARSLLENKSGPHY